MTHGVPPDPSEERAQNQLFRALSHQHRRFILRLLRQHRELRLSTVAENIARREHDGPIDEIPAHEIQAVSIDLYHRHIPNLVEADLVDHAEKRDILTISDRGLTGYACLEEVTE